MKTRPGDYDGDGDLDIFVGGRQKPGFYPVRGRTCSSNQAQISSVNSIITADLDKDGKMDLVLGGNLFGSEAETPRNDASKGLFLKGDGTGNFIPVPASESGLYMGGDVKETSFIQLGKEGVRCIVSARNSGPVQLHIIN